MRGKLSIELGEPIETPTHRLTFSLNIDMKGQWTVLLLIQELQAPQAAVCFALPPDQALALRVVIDEMDLIAKAHAEGKPVTFYLPDLSANSLAWLGDVDL